MSEELKPPADGSVTETLMDQIARHPETKVGRLGPGRINLAGDIKGHYSQCKALFFPDVDALNAYFDSNPNLLLVDLISQHTGGFVCLITAVLSFEEIQEMQQVQFEVDQILNKRRAEREAQKLQEEEKAQAEEKEKARLIEAGKTCDAHHAGLVDELRTLRAQVKKLQKGKGK